MARLADLSKSKANLVWLVAGMLVGLTAGALGPAQAYVDNARYELERTRNALLDRRDQLRKSYYQLLRDSDDLNRQLDVVQSRIKCTYNDIRRTESALSDVEYSMR